MHIRRNVALRRLLDSGSCAYVVMIMSRRVVSSPVVSVSGIIGTALDKPALKGKKERKRNLGVNVSEEKKYG